MISSWLVCWQSLSSLAGTGVTVLRLATLERHATLRLTNVSRRLVIIMQHVSTDSWFVGCCSFCLLYFSFSCLTPVYLKFDWMISLWSIWGVFYMLKGEKWRCSWNTPYECYWAMRDNFLERRWVCVCHFLNFLNKQCSDGKCKSLHKFCQWTHVDCVVKGELKLDKKWQSVDFFYIIMNEIYPRSNQFWVILKIS